TEGVSSGCEASAVYEEIARDYAALQTRLGRDLSTSCDRGRAICRLSQEADRMAHEGSTREAASPRISRSFTRKLHEWEKSRGIAPEASTSALLRAARAAPGPNLPALTRTQSDGSVGPVGGVSRVHVSSLSVNDADDLDAELERERLLEATDECDGKKPREAVLVEVEAEEICTAAPLVAVSPRHTPQKPVYTYDQAEPRLLCETSAAITGTAIKTTEKSMRRRISRQTSLEEDAKFIRQTIKEIERGSRYKESASSDKEKDSVVEIEPNYSYFNTKGTKQLDSLKENKNGKDNDGLKEEKRKEFDKGNGKKKSKSRARLERQQSKPSESDTEPDIDTVTVEIPRRKKRTRRPSERPRTPPTSIHSDSEGEVFVLKLKASEVHDITPEVIVKTTRKIFSPVVRSGETIPRAVIPLDVEDLPAVRARSEQQNNANTKKPDHKESKSSIPSKESGKSSGDVQDEELRTKSRPPLPVSPPSQRKLPPKETAPSIRIMIQRYNQKINEEGPPSGASSGTTSPSWRSPKLERRRPPDMPAGVNIRKNPFLEREVQKSASACQLSRREQILPEISPAPTQLTADGVLKSHSANALHPQQAQINILQEASLQLESLQVSASPSVETIVPRIVNTIEKESLVMRQHSMVTVSTLPRLIDNIGFGRSISTVDDRTQECLVTTTERLSERAAKIKAAKERFLASPPLLRREGTNSASDLRPADRRGRAAVPSSTAVQPGSPGRHGAAEGRQCGVASVSTESTGAVAE
ncbi:unnamed protein product, partial [Leptidea sinapis]